MVPAACQHLLPNPYGCRATMGAMPATAFFFSSFTQAHNSLPLLWLEPS